MKLVTHYVFSTGLLTLLSSFFLSFYTAFFFSSVIAVLGNTLIDRLGHKEIQTRRGLIPVRTPLTHTLPRSVVWGFIPALGLSLLFYYAYHYLSEELLLLVLVSLLNGPSHMLLDAFTERGIYVKRNGKWRRVALAHFSYDNPLVNGLAILLGILMLFVAMHNHNYDYYYYHYYNYYS
ncbi:Protein of unknown function DUF1286 [Sulfolobus islandicus L.S.2.15]|uniref:Membrane-bound metal-dependent hydrolase n=2 Tax=Saccharolobus islandicus TaxID=43080 RepID=C3MQP9_SACI2|nr:DUF1286 domain-containing protein [Sulfolobus islandicus]ACP35712.1 Protein of unknown function DUF1286 [Sulfolobus islandicus L.S.2.15]ADB87495.1 Protein of unknown function DUF1286 [Sulfolobus islandicus L.D.8.5]